MKWHSIVKWVGGVLSAFLAGWLCEVFKDYSFPGMIWSFMQWIGSLLRIKLELWIFLLFLTGLVIIIFIVLHFLGYKSNRENIREKERKFALVKEVLDTYKEEQWGGILWTFSWSFSSGQWRLCNLQACCPKCRTPLYGSRCPRCNTYFYGNTNLINDDEVRIIIQDNFNKKFEAIKANLSV